MTVPIPTVSPLSTNEGPAILMEKSDHRLTASWGSSLEAKAYRAQQAELIRIGDFKGAQQMDISNIQSVFGDKYNVPIQQMQNYTNTLKTTK